MRLNSRKLGPPQQGAGVAAYAGIPAGILLTLVFASQTAGAQAYNECGSLENKYGPWDYTNSGHFTDRLPVVEGNHFTVEVETLEGHNKCGGNGCMLANDIDYTLRAFPNHHRALMSMARYHLRGMDKTGKPLPMKADCYFERAIRFTPRDGTVRGIYGYYLNKIGKPEEALEQFEVALSISGDSAEAHYNAGLIYADLRRYPDARKHAYRAYELGFPLPGLRRKLERAGEWDGDDADLASVNQ